MKKYRIYGEYKSDGCFHPRTDRNKKSIRSECIRCQMTKGYKTILSELEKCILLCSNCHKEIHEGIIK